MIDHAINDESINTVQEKEIQPRIQHANKLKINQKEKIKIIIQAGTFGAFIYITIGRRSINVNDLPGHHQADCC